MPVAFSGCKATFADGSCLPGGAELVIWLASPGAVQDAALDGRAVALSCVPLDGGQRCRVPLSAGARKLTIRPPDDSGMGPWTLTLQAPPPPGPIEAAEAMMAAGRYEEGSASLHAALPALPAARQGQARSVLARLAFRAGDTEGALTQLERSIAAHAQAGRAVEQVTDAGMRNYLLLSSRGIGAARAAWESAALPDSPSLDATYIRAYCEGINAWQASDVRVATERLQQARRLAQQADDPRRQVEAGSLLLDVRMQGGQPAEAVLQMLATLDGKEGQALDPADRAREEINLGWAWLMAIDAGAQLDVDPAAMARRIEAAARPGAGVDRADRHQANARLNLASLRSLQQDWASAGAELDRARALEAEMDVDQRLWLDEIEARVRLGAGQPQASLDAALRLQAHARAQLSLTHEWRAALGVARARQALGDPEQALAAYAAATALFARHSHLVPAQGGRDRFLASWDAATRAQVTLLLDEGRPQDAVAVVRSWRASYLRTWALAGRIAELSPEERARWETLVARYGELQREATALGAESWGLSDAALEAAQAERSRLAEQATRLLDRGLELTGEGGGAGSRPPQIGELLITFYELDSGWVGFAQDATGLQVARLGHLNPTQPSEAWFAPFAGALSAATQLTLLPTGDLRAADLPAWPFQGAPLLAFRPVAIGLDLGRSGPTTDTPAPRRALLVVDPGLDLPAAREEALAIQAALGARQVSVQLLQGEAASREAVLAALDGVELLHHAGHGAFDGDGWQSALLLAQSGRFSASDVLARGHAPEVVVLSSCEGAKSGATPLESMGLAQAFLAAGSGAVIAAVRPVDDRVAAHFSAALYADGLSGGVPLAFQRAALAARQDDPASDDWAAFRLLVP